MLPFNTASFLFSIAYNLKLPSLLRYLLRTFYHNPPILLFCHRILPPKSSFSRLDEFYHRLGHPALEEFESQLRYLSRHHSVASMEDVVNYIVRGKVLPDSPVALTFDDGYRDNHKLAFPVLRDYGFKAAFFLTTDFIDSGKIPFHDRIIYALCHTKKKRIFMEGDANMPHEYILGTISDRIRCFLDIQMLFKNLPYERRAAYVQELLAVLEVEVDGTFSDNLMLTWEEIEEMHSAGHSFYSHTRSHPLLTGLSDRELEQEIIESNNIILEKLNVNGSVFCYPYGKKGELNEAIINLLKGHGFKAACSAIHGLNREGDDPFKIKRTAMISEPIGKFAMRTAGLFEIMKELQAGWKGR